MVDRRWMMMARLLTVEDDGDGCLLTVDDNGRSTMDNDGRSTVDFPDVGWWWRGRLLTATTSRSLAALHTTTKPHPNSLAFQNLSERPFKNPFVCCHKKSSHFYWFQLLELSNPVFWWSIQGKLFRVRFKIFCSTSMSNRVFRKNTFFNKTEKAAPPTYPSGVYITQIQKLFLFGQV